MKEVDKAEVERLKTEVIYPGLTAIVIGEPVENPERLRPEIEMLFGELKAVIVWASALDEFVAYFCDGVKSDKFTIKVASPIVTLAFKKRLNAISDARRELSDTIKRVRDESEAR